MQKRRSDDKKWVVSVCHEFPASPASPHITPLWASSPAFAAEITAEEEEEGTGSAQALAFQTRTFLTLPCGSSVLSEHSL